MAFFVVPSRRQVGLAVIVSLAMTAVGLAQQPCNSNGDCDDGLFCTGEETCVANQCQPGENPCLGLDRVCDEASDACVECLQDGDCSDGLTCTTDTCNVGLQQCNHSTDPGYCLIAMVCYADGTPDPTNDCRECNVTLDPAGWSFRPAGTGCEDDGLFCTGIEVCDGAGACIGSGDPCAGGAACVEQTNECVEDADCNTNGLLDACDISCAALGGYCNTNGCGQSADCNTNAIPDECDAAAQEAKITADDGAAGDYFAYSVSVSGNVAIVGAYQDNDNGIWSGAAYVFRYTGSGWQQEAKLTADDGAEYDRFSRSVSVSGSVAIVGAYGDDDNGSASGSAYVFRYTGSGWEQEAKLTAGDGAAKDYFGLRVSVSGNVAVVGAYGDDDNGDISGSAYVFRCNGSGWQQEAKLTADDGASGDVFGWSVSVSGNVAVVGAPYDGDNGHHTGSAYVFRYAGPTWQQEAKLTADDGTADDYFGYSVSVNGSVAVAGAHGDDDNGSKSGSTYVFRHNGSGWEQQAKLTAEDGAADDYFGRAVSVSGNVGVAGAHYDDDNGFASGSAYVFVLRDDCDANGVLDECDIADGAGPDCNLNRALDECDIASGVSQDCNANFIPDECDPIGGGDFDADGDVDLADFDAFADCLAGPDAAPSPLAAECIAACHDAFDDDDDGDVDLADFAAFQSAFGG